MKTPSDINQGVNQMRKLSVIRGFNKDIGIIYDAMRSVTNRAWIAGGYAAYCVSQNIQPPKPGDVDIFPQSERDFMRLCECFYDMCWTQSSSERAISFAIAGIDEDIQVIRPGENHWTPRKLVSDFDFTVCRAVMLSPTCVLVDSWFESDTLNNRLRIMNINNPMGAMMRIAKYSQKGYEIAPSEYVKILEDFQQASPESRQKLLNDFRHEDWDAWERVRNDEPFIDDDWDDDDYPGYDYY